jgi:hypothetical protein
VVPGVDSMLLGGPPPNRGLRLGKLGLSEAGLGDIGSHLGDGEDAGINKFGGADTLRPNPLRSSASEYSLSEVGSHFTLLPNFPVALRVKLWQFLSLAKPFSL